MKADPRQREINASTRGSPRRERSGEMEKKRTILYGLNEMNSIFEPLNEFIREIERIDILDSESKILIGKTIDSDRIGIELFLSESLSESSRIIIKEKKVIVNLPKSDAEKIQKMIRERYFTTFEDGDDDE